MTNRQAIRKLIEISRKILVNSRPEFLDAIAEGVRALRSAPDYKRLAVLGGKARAKKYDRKTLSEWAKKGGRPRKRKAAGRGDFGGK